MTMLMGTLLAAGLVTGLVTTPDNSEVTILPTATAPVNATVQLCDMGHGRWLGGTLQIDEPSDEAGAGQHLTDQRSEGRAPCWFV